MPEVVVYATMFLRMVWFTTLLPDFAIQAIKKTDTSVTHIKFICMHSGKSLLRNSRTIYNGSMTAMSSLLKRKHGYCEQVLHCVYIGHMNQASGSSIIYQRCQSHILPEQCMLLQFYRFRIFVTCNIHAYFASHQPNHSCCFIIIALLPRFGIYTQSASPLIFCLRRTLKPNMHFNFSYLMYRQTTSIHSHSIVNTNPC